MAYHYSQFIRSFYPNGTATRFVSERIVHDQDAEEVVCLEPDVIRRHGSIAAAALNDSVCHQLGDSNCNISIVHSHYSLDSEDEFADACDEKYRQTAFRPPKRLRRDPVYNVFPGNPFRDETFVIDNCTSDSDTESEYGPRSSTPIPSEDGSTSSPPVLYFDWNVALPDAALQDATHQLYVSMTLSNSHFDSFVIDTSICDSDESTLPLVILDCETRSSLPPQACKESRQPPVFELL